MTVAPLSLLRTIPVWEDPHAFAQAGARVFSYGLLLPELEPHALHDDGFQARLARRWGKEEVETLSHRLAPRMAPGIFDTTIAQLLVPFREAVLLAAGEGGFVPDGWAEPLKTFLDRAPSRPDRFVWRWRVTGADSLVRVRAALYRELLHRLTLEFDHLVTHQPRLARCKACGRVFVPLRPARPEVHCRANLWHLGAPPVLVERCAPIDVDEETARKRGEKRLHQAYRRARQAHGDEDARTRKAKSEWRRWQQRYPAARERGRQSTPEVTYQPEGDEHGE